MKIKTSELTGAVLDWAVATSTYKTAPIKSACTTRFRVLDDDGEHVGSIWITEKRTLTSAFAPSSNWVQGGSLIDQHGIWLSDDNDESPEKWIASVGGVHTQTGPTPLIAAMRALVTSRLGDEIEVPDELAQAAADAEVEGGTGE